MADLGMYIRVSAVGADRAEDALNKVANTADKLERKSGSASGKVDDLGNSLEKTGRKARDAEQYLGLAEKAIKGLVTLQVTRSLLDIGDNYRAMSERVRMATDSLGEFNFVQQRLLQSANTSFRSLAEAQEMFIATSGNLRSMGYSLGQALDITDSLSFAFVRNATSAQRAESAIIQYDKALSKGVMNGEQWRVFSGAVETVAKNIGDVYGKTAQEIDKMGHDGLLTVQMINEGLLRSLNENKVAADSMANTVGDSFVKLNNEFSHLWGNINESLGVTSLFASTVIGIADNLEYALIPVLVAASVVTGRMTSGLITTANSFRKSAFEASRYQVKLAELTGASRVAARSMVATSVAAQGLSSTIAFLGGPVGALTTAVTIATGGWMLFANSTRDAKSEVGQLEQEVMDLTERLKTMNKEKVEGAQIKYSDMFLDLSEKRRGLESDIDAIESQLEGFYRRQRLYAARGVEDASTNNLIARDQKRLALLKEEATYTDDALKIVSDTLELIQERAKTAGGQIIEMGAWARLAKNANEGLNLAGKSLDLYSSMAKKMYEINNNGVEAQLAFERAVGNLDDMDESTYQVFLNWAKIIDQQQLMKANDEELTKILSDVEEQYDNIGKSVQEITRAKLIARAVDLGIDPEQLKELEFWLTAIGNAPNVGGKTSLNYFDDTLKSLNDELISTKALTQDLTLFGDLSQYTAFSEMTMQLNDTKGVLANITASQRELLLYKAQELDSQKQINAILELGRDTTQDLDDLEFEISLYGKSQKEIERLTFFRDLDNEARLISIGMTEDNIAVLNREIEALKERYGLIEMNREHDENSIGKGIESGFQQYIDNIGTMRDSFADATQSVFGNIEGFLVDFAHTGKLNFRDMTTSILQDLSQIMIRIAMMQAVTGMQGWLSGLGLFSGGGSVPISPGIPYQAWTGGLIPEYATGGRVIDFSGGGFTGMGGKFEPKGIVHGGEYVMSKAAVNNLGVGYFEQLHDLAKSGRGFANGGHVGRSSTQMAMMGYMPANHSTPQQQSQPSGDVVVHQTIHYQSSGDGKEDARKAAKEFAESYKTEFKKLLKDEVRDGGMIGPRR
ncbi:tape measure protein [Ignatzschineria rhizosphaerae]|uniref:Tape measure protein n=1 Tax=Ignatzschineria rhizosphaerae TaxID=2923279 RepID=A0ABY3X2G4_9GAMM|nr:tape measure protein [Ignatzschineria rhizosphaerae]UNM95961.1 tape measure protein [Ignatzschineria rhizosphaerae]